MGTNTFNYVHTYVYTHGHTHTHAHAHTHNTHTHTRTHTHTHTRTQHTHTTHTHTRTHAHNTHAHTHTTHTHTLSWHRLWNIWPPNHRPIETHLLSSLHQAAQNLIMCVWMKGCVQTAPITQRSVCKCVVCTYTRMYVCRYVSCTPCTYVRTYNSHVTYVRISIHKVALSHTHRQRERSRHPWTYVMQGCETVGVHTVDVISFLQEPTALLLVSRGDGWMEHDIRVFKAQLRLAAFHAEIGFVCGQLALVPSLLLLKTLLGRVGAVPKELIHTPLSRPLLGGRFPNNYLTECLLGLELTVLVLKDGGHCPSARNVVVYTSRRLTLAWHL